MKLSQTVHHVIGLAGALNESRTIDNSVEALTTDSPVGPPPAMRMNVLRPEEKQLRAFLDGQPADVIYMLAAIMYLGEGDIDTREELLESFADLNDAADPHAAVRQIMEKVALPEYLHEGLKRLVQINLDVDSLLPS